MSKKVSKPNSLKSTINDFQSNDFESLYSQVMTFFKLEI